MSRDYPRLSIEEFGRQLITSGDLDPIYIAMDRCQWSNDEHRSRWLIAYWCMYHAGSASWLSEKPGLAFWNELMTAAKNISPTPTGERWPRGHERRHWRGQQAVDSCNSLMERYGEKPEKMVDYIADTAAGDAFPVKFVDLARRAQEHRAFGPWISFKIGDMVDRLGIQKVNFLDADVFMFKDPTTAAKMLYAQKQGLPPQMVREGSIKVNDSVIPGVVKYLEDQFKDLDAPPQQDRPIALQEVETVLCKWKSHLNGHYPLYNDIDEITEGLKPWTTYSITARMMLDAMPGHAQ